MAKRGDWPTEESRCDSRPSANGPAGVYHTGPLLVPPPLHFLVQYAYLAPAVRTSPALSLAEVFRQQWRFPNPRCSSGSVPLRNFPARTEKIHVSVVKIRREDSQPTSVLKVLPYALRVQFIKLKHEHKNNLTRLCYIHIEYSPIFSLSICLSGPSAPSSRLLLHLKTNESFRNPPNRFNTA